MEISLYDYISLRADSLHSKYITVDLLMEVLTNDMGCKKVSNASCAFAAGDYIIRVQGIPCDNYGNYSFNSDESFSKVNLIEINLPPGSESEYETEIIAFTKSLADKVGWEIDWKG